MKLVGVIAFITENQMTFPVSEKVTKFSRRKASIRKFEPIFGQNNEKVPARKLIG